MNFKEFFRKIGRRFGFEIKFLKNTSIGIFKNLLKSEKINVILDVGANRGQYGEFLRNVIGYSGRIVSFEPQPNVFNILKAKAEKDPFWDVFNFGLGNKTEKKEINISENPCLGSFLDATSELKETLPQCKTLGKQTLEIKTLDSIIDDLCLETDSICLKSDTQGYEKNVLEGGENSLKHINLVQLEMSFIPLYDGETLFHNLHELMLSKGFLLVSLESAYFDPKTKQIFQVDGIFYRS